MKVLVTPFGTFQAPPEMVAAAKKVKWRRSDSGMPDMRTKAGKRWAGLFRDFLRQKCNELLAA